MTAPHLASEVELVTMRETMLEAVMAVELAAYAKPWQAKHFLDCMKAGHHLQVLMAGNTIVGYFVAMPGHEEVHLLNITVHPAFQGQGWAKVMLDNLVVWAGGQGAHWLWLEVRTGNTRAIHVYQAQGFVTVGRRKHYYPTAQGPREDALVMGKRLTAPPETAVGTIR